MKRTRKLASLLLALVMVFALATTAFATEAGTTTTTGTITVDNPVAGQTYTAYKIFDVVYDAAKEHYSYTIASTSEWFNTVSTYANDTTHGLTLTQVNGGDTYVVTTGNGFSAPDFAATLKTAVSGKTGKELTASGSSVTVDNLPLGYYFVASTSGALCNLTTTNPAVTIHDKNDMPFDKVDDQESVDVGQTVNYTITGKVPDTTGFGTYTYLITDTMSEGLTFQKNVKVSIGETDIATGTVATWITYKPAAGSATGFELTIPVKDYQDQVGAEIKVTYSAVVNERAVAKIAKNKAVLKYSNDPTDNTKFGTTPPDEEKVYTSKIVINKFETGKEETKLPNAEFVLYKLVGDGTTKNYYKWDETEKKVGWVADMADATVVKTNEGGAASFDGLANGTYYLVETKAPAGYNQLTEAKEVTVAGSTTDTAKLSVTAKVANSTGTLLPSTGGMGTTVFYVLGAVLVLGAVVLLVTKKRMSDANR